MRKIYFLLLTVLFAAVSNAQNITVSGATSGNGSYATLGAAFTAINGGAQAGANIIIDVTGNTTEAASAVLNAGTWASISIVPLGGGSRTISGSIAGPLIDLNGADNISINGLNTGGNSLTLSNTNTGSAGTTTIRFIGDASGNTVTNCTISGSSTSATLGSVFFSTGITTGNDNNVISNSTINAAGVNLPANAVYASGTASFENSGNSITNCNISDYFSATLVSTAILIGGNNTDWTISNNRFFQSGVRTYTTANTHRAIQVTAGNNYLITGNTIGFATNASTGTYTMAGTVATRFIAIDLAVGTTTATSVQGNTVTAINLATSSGAATVNGVLCGINVSSGNANIGNVTPNTIGASSGTGALVATPTATQGAIVGISSGSTNTILIQNNIIGGFTSSGTTATIAGAVFGITVSGVATSIIITGNTIGNGTADNMRAGTNGLTTGASQAVGISIPSTPVSISVTSNTIQNLTSYGTSTSGFVRGITGSTTINTTASYTVSQNTITNLTTTGATSGYTSGNCSAQGIQFSGGANGVCSQNIISNISNTNAAATNNMVVAGIILASGANTSAFGNRIWNLSNAGTGTTVTGPPVVAGIIVRSGTTGVSVYNNMISIGEGQTTNTCFLGIMLNHGSTPDPVDNIYFNSIVVSGTVAAGALISSCLNRGDLTATARNQTVDIRNNIFINTRTGGTGAHYAISNNPNAASTGAGWASNYNLLNASAGTIGYWNTSLTFAGWQAASGGDANSLSGGTVNFINSTTADLHITTPFPSIIESAGVNIPAVAVDYDGQARAGLSPTDIGADAGDFSFSPAIVLTPLAGTCTPGARTITVSISDPDGVPTSGIGLPVLYWRINGGAYVGATGTFLSGNQYSFNFGAGAVVGDVVTYYVVAQDNLGNAGSWPLIGASGFTANPPAAATPPTTPYSYTLNLTLAGLYTVGVAGNYPTLSAAVNSYNNSCLAGPVVFNLIDATYPSETFPITINANPGASAINSLTIKATVPTSITGSSASSIILLNGADYVNINGSTSSIISTFCPLAVASRDLTITNTNPGVNSAVVWFGTTAVGDPVTNAAIQNCILIGNSPSTTIAGAGAGGAAIGTGGTNNDNLFFVNNDIRACRVGIYSSGASGGNKNQNLVVNQNIMTAAAPNNIGETGIYSAFTNNVLVGGNVIDNIVRTGSPDGVGINMGFGAVNGIAATTTGIADGVSNVTITHNIIGTITNSGTFSSAGIAVGNTITGTTLIANNMISGVNANGTSGDFAGGIILGGGTAPVSVYHNTVSMQGTITGTSAGTQLSSCLAVTSATPAPIDIRNNIFSNTQLGNAAATLRFTAIALGYSAPYTGLTSSNNDLYSSGAGPGTYAVGTTGGLVAGTLRTTLANWQSEIGGDANSQSVIPVFTSTTDLHLVNTPGTNWCLNGTGISIPAITNDIDCQVRNTLPDLGADEFIPTGFVINNPAPACSGGTVDLTAAAITSGSMGGLTFTYFTDAAATIPLATPAAVGISGTYYIKASNGTCYVILPVVVTISGPPTAFTVTGGGNFCPGGAGVPVGLSGSELGVTYQLQLNTVNTGAPVIGTNNPISFGNQTGLGTYTVVATAPCSGPMTGSVIIGYYAPLNIPGVLTQPTTCVSPDGAINVTVSGGVGPYTYSWSTSGGSGVVPAAEDQTGLTVGQYTVVVTDQGTTCQTTANFTLTGPGGCAICPTIGALATNPTPAVCSNSPVTLTASGLTSMGITYGITFKYSTVALADPYVGGTVIATVPNGSLTSGGTVATTSTSFATSGSYFLYAILSPVPADPTCRPFSQSGLDVNPIPTVNAVANQALCNGGSTTAVTFTGAVPGTVYNWTNSTPSIGLAASGLGNIASFTATNATSAPVVATITVTPTYSNGGATCAGTPITFTITVNPTPVAVATPASQSACSGTPITTIVLSSAVSGTTYTWTRNNTVTVTGIAASGSGNISGTLTNTTGAAVTVTFTITPSANGCPGTPITATVIVNPTPSVSQGTMQVFITGSNDWADEITWTLTNSVGTVVLSGGPYGFNPPPTPSATTPATNAPFSFFIEANGTFNDNSCLWEVRCNGNVVASGCIRGTNSLSSCASTPTLTVPNISGCGSNLGAQTICSGSAITPIVLTGTPPGTVFNWTRNNTATVTGIPASGTGNISGTLTNTTSAPVVVAFTITPSFGGCNGTPVVVNVTVNPTPDAVATPAAQTICTGTPITPIVLTGAVSGTTYSWTRNNTATVTGIAASGTGNISGTLTNTTGLPVTVTFTITPSANGCPGTPITATVTVNQTLTITCPANITAASVVGGCTAVVTYAPVVVGTPVPTLTYVLSGATTGSGSGSGSGTAFRVGVTTVTLTATNSCGVATCSFTVTVTDSQLPVITAQPTNRTVCVGSSATFNVTATNAVSYQWQQWNGTTWTNVGTNLSSFTLNNIAFTQNTNTFRVIINGLCTVVTSNAATLYVNALPTIIITPSRTPVLLPTETVTLTATAVPTGGTYTWFRNGVAIPGVTGAVLAGLTVDDAGTYKVVYTDPNGCTTTSADIIVSAAASSNLLVYPNPNNGVFHVRFYNVPNEDVTLSVYDAKGAMVYRKKETTGLQYTRMDVDISSRPAGVYLVEIRDASGKLLQAKRIILGH